MKKLLFFILFIGLIQPAFAQTAKAIDPKLQELKNQLAAAKHDTTRMMALFDIADYNYQILVCSDSTLFYALKAEQLANKYPNYHRTPEVFDLIGNTYLLNRNKTTDATLKKKYLEIAEQYYKKSFDFARTANNEDFILRSWYNLNKIFFFSSKYRYFKGSFELINYIQKKAQLNNGDSLILKWTYEKICNKLVYEMGSKKFNTYLALLKNFTLKRGYSYENLCILTFNQQANIGKKSDEQHILKQYTTYQQDFKRPYAKDELDLALAQYYFTIQDYKKSYQLCADFSPQKYDNSELAQFRLALLGIKYMLMGQSAYMLNRNEETIHHLQQAISFFNTVLEEGGQENDKYTTLLYLSKAYKKAGNYKQALDCNEQADTLYKQMHDIGTQALMAENDVQLEQIKQDKKVQEAETQTLLKEQEASLQKRQKNIFILISIIALLSLAWAVFSFLKKKKLSETLAEQNIVIKEQAQSLAESNRLKDRIFALLGHDLRAPINRLIMSINQSADKQSDMIQPALKGVQDTLNNVLYWSSMEIKGITPVYTTMPLKTVVESLVEEYKFDLKDKDITFLNAIDKTINIKADENYLKIILRNLINNAIKFTNPKGYIQIDCTVKDTLAEISLKDTGIGIPPDKIDSLFNLPMPSLGTKREKGTGLGLSLSQGIAQKLNGDIRIKSQVGKGTQVRLTLPV